MKKQLRARAGRALAKTSPAAAQKVEKNLTLRQQLGVSRRRIARLEARVSELESEMQETRRLNYRLAELTDVVQELLIPIAARDEDKVREHLERYSASL
jgi:hypothetical protein